MFLTVDRYDLEVILVGLAAAASSALLGVFLVLRRSTMLADAISHAVLPGLVLGYLVSGSRETWILLIGAGIAALACTLGIEFLKNKAGLHADLSIGLVFTLFFAVGVILLTVFASSIDLDQDCVLYGEIAYAPLERTEILGTDIGPASLYKLLGILAVVISFITTFYRQLRATSFDEAYTRTVGMRAQAWHYALMALVSACTVVAFESVGAILIVALIVGPAATALLITRSLLAALWIALVIAFITVLSGYGLAYNINGSVAGGIAVMIGVVYFVTYVISRRLSL